MDRPARRVRHHDERLRGQPLHGPAARQPDQRPGQSSPAPRRMGLDVLVAGDAAAVGKDPELRGELAIGERAEPRAVAVLGQPAGVRRPLRVEGPGRRERRAVVGREPEFEGAPPVLVAGQRTVVSQAVPMRRLPHRRGRHDRTPLDAQAGFAETGLVGRARLRGVDAEGHVLGGREYLGEPGQPPSRLPGFGGRREQQEVAPPVGRVGRRPDHNVVPAVGDLAALHGTDHQVRPVTEGGDLHRRSITAAAAARASAMVTGGAAAARASAMVTGRASEARPT